VNRGEFAEMLVLKSEEPLQGLLPSCDSERPEIDVWGDAILVVRNDVRAAARALRDSPHVVEFERWLGVQFQRRLGLPGLSVFQDGSP
jgi:hypothetical protein